MPQVLSSVSVYNVLAMCLCTCRVIDRVCQPLRARKKRPLRANFNVFQENEHLFSPSELREWRWRVGARNSLRFPRCPSWSGGIGDDATADVCVTDRQAHAADKM